MDKSSLDPNKNSNSTLFLQFANIALEFAFLIAVPLLAFIFLGKWLDAKLGTQYFVLIGIPLAITISSVAVYKRIKIIAEQLKRN